MNRFFGEFVGGRGALGLLIVRVIFGLGIMQHGWSKIQKPFTWMGPDSPVPGFLQALAALSEFGGGIALILGLLTPIAMFGLACTMLTAILMVHVKAGDPFVARGGGRSYELAALYLGFAVMMILTGPGKLSIDARLFGRRYDWIDRR
ncbi:MAG: DoxX family protein [Acidobacteria bacterium]|nr:DoxX family protein [Acidobacteriota bacterium]